MPFALDLDGVIWLADTPIPGAADAVRRLQATGEPVVFVTNNSSQPVGEVEAKLARHGVAATGEVITSAMAAARLLEPGERVLVCGGPGVVEAVEGRGAVVVRDGLADAVLVGFHREFDYERLRIAAAAVRAGARLLATNDDATYPTPDGPIPGGGAILASIATATGVRPIVAGKPHAPHGRPGARPAGRARRDGGGPSRHRRAPSPARSASRSRWCTAASRTRRRSWSRGRTSWPSICRRSSSSSCRSANSCKHSGGARRLAVMAQNDLLKRYIDAGVSFTALTQSRAERLVRELVKAGELQADQAREAVVDLVERSRKSSERLIELISAEVRSQITSLGLASQADLDRIERRVAKLMGKPGPKKPKAPEHAPAKKAPAKKATAKKAAAKKAPAKKAAAKKAAKKAAAKKAPAAPKAPEMKVAPAESPVEKA